MLCHFIGMVLSTKIIEDLPLGHACYKEHYAHLAAAEASSKPVPVNGSSNN